MIKIWRRVVSYTYSSVHMHRYVQSIKEGKRGEACWLLEHTPVYTYGARTPSDDIERLRQCVQGQIVPTLRGGKLTYHGPGQRMIYGMINLKERKMTIQDYVFSLEQWIIDGLKVLSIESHRLPPHTGIWTSKGKIASLGVHVSSGITSYGACLNVSCDMAPFFHIEPCGLSGHQMTSLWQVAPPFSFQEVDGALLGTCPFFL
jgi:lipoyl(octanoyl) transferase